MGTFTSRRSPGRLLLGPGPVAGSRTRTRGLLGLRRHAPDLGLLIGSELAVAAYVTDHQHIYRVTALIGKVFGALHPADEGPVRGIAHLPADEIGCATRFAHLGLRWLPISGPSACRGSDDFFVVPAPHGSGCLSFDVLVLWVKLAYIPAG